MTFVYGFLPEGILQSWVKDPNRRCNKMEFEASRTTKNWREKSSLKNYYTCEEIEKFNTLKEEKVNKNRPWDDAGDN